MYQNNRDIFFRSKILNCAGHTLVLSRPQVMGIINITPDSFFSESRHIEVSSALRCAERMLKEGVDIIDIGGESTRPNAVPVTLQEELDRIIPVVESIANQVPVPISLDTSNPKVMEAAIAHGAGFINDIRGLEQPGAVEMVAQLRVPVCIMHMQGFPSTMQNLPTYIDVVSEVKSYLRKRISTCVANGIHRSRIVIDPGFGFGKNLTHNLRLLRELNKFQTLRCPILVGVSRKSMIGQVLNVPIQERLYGSISAAVIAFMRGATIIRVHDVQPIVQALRMAEAVLQ